MAKHIDADALKEWVENWFEKNRYYHPYSKSNNIPIPELYDILGQMPTADVVEVVRCGVCKYHDDIDAPGMVYCPNVIGGWVSERFFCAGGERREDD